MVQTKLRVLGQLALCKGCCCGNTERGLPGVPVDRIKAIWKSEKLNRTIHLTISGCLGPCDVPNVALIITQEGQEWFAELETDAHYEALVRWARACQEVGQIVARPAEMERHRLERFKECAIHAEVTNDRDFGQLHPEQTGRI
jgi:hypothetical protein